MGTEYPVPLLLLSVVQAAVHRAPLVVLAHRRVTWMGPGGGPQRPAAVAPQAKGVPQAAPPLCAAPGHRQPRPSRPLAVHLRQPPVSALGTRAGAGPLLPAEALASGMKGCSGPDWRRAAGGWRFGPADGVWEYAMAPIARRWGTAADSMTTALPHTTAA